MKIHLPLETWTDVFGFLSRSQLVAFSPHICDRQFASVLQFFLHKCGQITLGNLHITKSTNGNGPIIAQNNRELPLAEGPIPSIVVNFKAIRLHFRHFNSSVFDFMQELQRNSLLENVNLILEYSSDDLLAFLLTIMPLIASINSIDFFDLFIYKSACSKLVKPMLKSTRVLKTWDCLSNDWYCEWLYLPREDGKPRVLVLYGSPSFSSFIEHIKKDFLSAKRAISFFIHLRHFSDIVQLELQNEETSEKLEILIDWSDVLISRHPIGTNEEWIKEMSKPKNEYRNIFIS